MSSPQYLVLVRHGESEANRDLSHTDCGLYYSQSGSDPDVPLTATGTLQGIEVGQRLARMFPSSRQLTRVYHNEFARVKQTMDLCTQDFGYDVQRISDSRLNKRCYGRFWNLTRKGVEVLYPHEYTRYIEEGDRLYRAPEGGENYPDVFARVDDFVDREINTSTGNALVITHSVVVLAFRRKIEGISDLEVVRLYEEMSLPNAQILVFCRTTQNDPWQPCDSESIGIFNPGCSEA